MTSVLQQFFDSDLTKGAFFSNDLVTRQMAFFRSFGRMKVGLGADHDGGTDGQATSTSSLLVGTGVKTFSSLLSRVPAADASWLARFSVGSRCRVFASEEVWMEGVILSRTISSMSINVDKVNGSGVFASWYISPITGGSWVQTIDSPGLIPRVVGWDYAEDQARLSVVEKNRIAINGSAMTDVSGISGIAGQFFTTARNGGYGWAIQSEAVRQNSGRAKGIELGAATMTPLLSVNPLGSHWTTLEDMAVGAWIMAGCDKDVWGESYAAQAAIFVGQNGSVWNRGVIFANNGLKREGQPDDQVVANKGWHESDAVAIESAYRHVFTWSSRDPTSPGGPRPEVVRIGSRVANPSIRWEVAFTDGAIDFAEKEGPGSSVFRINYLADADAYMAAQPAVAGQAPRLQAQGTAANINAYLAGKGTGLAGFLNAAETTAVSPTFNRRQRVVLPNGEQMWVYGELIT
jgi:hypothetical protein